MPTIHTKPTSIKRQKGQRCMEKEKRTSAKLKAEEDIKEQSQKLANAIELGAQVTVLTQGCTLSSQPSHLIPPKAEDSNPNIGPDKHHFRTSSSSGREVESEEEPTLEKSLK